MGHDHSHGEKSSFLTEQLCTIALCGALGGIAVAMYLRYAPGEADSGKPWLALFLASMFLKPVFWGGVALLVMVAVRAVALWRLSGKRAPVAAAAHPEHAHEHHHHEGCEHEHTHSHGHDHDHASCGHDHSHEQACGHDHGHDHAHSHDHGHDHAHSHDHAHDDEAGHDHGTNPWRYAVLLFPVVLFFLDLPDDSCKAAQERWLAKQQGQGDFDTSTANLNFSPEVGLRLKQGETGRVIVLEVEKDSPAAKAGMQVGDSIIQITRSVGPDGKPDKPDVKPVDLKELQALSIEDVLKLLKGKSDDSDVELVIIPDVAVVPEVTKRLTRERKVNSLTFDEVERLTFDPGLRRLFDGKRVRIKGRYFPANRANTFSLARFKIVCCGADKRMLQMSIELPQDQDLKSLDLKPLDSWVEVEGQVQFGERANRPGEYMTILKVAALSDINKDTPPERD